MFYYNSNLKYLIEPSKVTNYGSFIFQLVLFLPYNTNTVVIELTQGLKGKNPISACFDKVPCTPMYSHDDGANLAPIIELLSSGYN